MTSRPYARARRGAGLAAELHCPTVMGGGFLLAFGGKQGAAVLAVLLVLAAGFCLFDGDMDGMGEGMDICATLMAATVVVATVAAPVESSWAFPTAAFVVFTASPHLPDPPPKPSLLV